MTASLAMRYTLPRRPRNPLACSRTFLCRARAVTPRLTLGIARSLRVRHHGAHRIHVGAMDLGGAATLTLGLCRLLGEDMAVERLRALDRAASAHAETLLRARL